MSYPPTVANLVLSSCLTASSVRLSKNTFCDRLLKCISCSNEAVLALASFLDITKSTPFSGRYLTKAAPIAFWNSLWALSIMSLRMNELSKWKNIDIFQDTHHSLSPSGTSISNLKNMPLVIGGLLFFGRTLSTLAISVYFVSHPRYSKT